VPARLKQQYQELKKNMKSVMLVLICLGTLCQAQIAPRHRHPFGLAKDVKTLRYNPDGSVAATSSNWAGYVITAPSGTITDSVGSWVMPTITCDTTTPTWASFWVGIDGWDTSTVEQIGVDLYCGPNSSVADYIPWYEFFPGPTTTINNFAVSPGDVIKAEVSYNPSTQQYTMSLTDYTTALRAPNVSFTVSDSVAGAEDATAEWISEEPGTPVETALTNFGTVDFGVDYTGIGPTCYATINGQTGPIGNLASLPGVILHQVNENNTTTTSSPPPPPAQENTSALTSDQSSFSVTELLIPPPPVIGSTILPQLAFGGGWSTMLYFANTTNALVTIPLNFVADDGAPMDVPITGSAYVPSPPSVTIAPMGVAMIEAINAPGSVVQEGYVTFSGVSGYGVFRQADQEALVPFSATNTTSQSFVYDDTSSVSAVAIANPSAVEASITVTVLVGLGQNQGPVGTSLTLPAGQKTEMTLRSLLPAIAGTWGMVTFTANTGNVAVLGLRFDSGGAFTSIPLL